MDDLNCPVVGCKREFSNTFNRDEHGEKCRREWQAGERAKHGQQSMFGFFSKAPAQPAAQNACAANPAAAAAAAAPEAAAPETMDVDGVHADASLPESPSLHAVSMPAFAPCMGFKPEWRQPFCAHYPFVLHDGAQPLPWSVTLPEGRFIAGDCLGSATMCHCCVQSALMGESKRCGCMAWQHTMQLNTRIRVWRMGSHLRWVPRK